MHASVASGVVLAGLSTTVLPAAIAGATLLAARVSGKFHGTIAPAECGAVDLYRAQAGEDAHGWAWRGSQARQAASPPAWPETVPAASAHLEMFQPKLFARWRRTRRVLPYSARSTIPLTS